jgi:hypothetical protein
MSRPWPDDLGGHLDEPVEGAVLRGETFWIRGWVPAGTAATFARNLRRVVAADSVEACR